MWMCLIGYIPSFILHHSHINNNFCFHTSALSSPCRYSYILKMTRIWMINDHCISIEHIDKRREAKIKRTKCVFMNDQWMTHRAKSSLYYLINFSLIIDSKATFVFFDVLKNDLDLYDHFEISSTWVHVHTTKGSATYGIFINV